MRNKTLTLLLTALLSHPTFAQELIFDADKLPEPTPISKAESAKLKKQVEPLARKKWAKEEDCSPELTFIDVKTGSFTAAVEQKAYVYQYCAQAMRGTSNQGIAIVEQGNLVANVLFSGSDVSGLITLADINNNGLDELLLTGGFTGQGSTITWITILELGDTVNRFGFTQVYEDNTATGREEITNTSLKIYVKAGESPRFFKDETVEMQKMNAKTEEYDTVNTKTQKQQPLILEKDDTQYKLNKFAP